jgi:hypothetical protein
MSGNDLVQQLSFLGRFVEKLDRVKGNAKVYRFSLREIARFYDASKGCIAFHDRVDDCARVQLELKEKGEWDLSLLTDFIKNKRPPIPPTMILAPLKLRKKIVGLLALSRHEPFARGDGKFLSRLADRISAELTKREENRLLRLWARISKEIMRGLRPKDVLYQLLDGLENLLRYDHSAAILILDGAKDAFVVQAEKVTWQKRKSQAIGLEIPTNPAVNGFLLTGDRPLLFNRTPEGGWRAWGSPYYLTVLQIVDYDKGHDAPPENSIICAALRS